jgi:hypothetical protein
MEGDNKKRYVTREQLVMFSQFQVRQQIMPLIGECIKAYHYETQQKRWYRRLGRWVKGLFVTKRLEVADLPADARAELRAELDAAETEPEEEQAPVQTCATCGSAQLEPVDETGGLRCHNGHVIEDPPLKEEAPDG